MTAALAVVAVLAVLYAALLRRNVGRLRRDVFRRDASIATLAEHIREQKDHLDDRHFAAWESEMGEAQ